MTRKTLHQLYAEHTGKVSDKWSLYLTEYDRVFDAYREKPVRLLEIGIQNGGSLEIWSKYFSNASILIGCDINPDCARLSYADPRIGVIVGDANARDTVTQVFSRCPQFDILIEDGSHRSSDIIKTFALYFPRLTEGGIFIAEDLHCSYWEQFEGGLFDPSSSIAFFKNLADVINHEHWGIPKARAHILRGIFEKYGCEVDEEALSRVHSVEFINSMCVVRKAPAVDNNLGRHVIVGLTELVATGLRGSWAPALDQSNNPWSSRSMSPDEAVRNAEILSAHAQQQIAELRQNVAERDAKIAGLAQAVAARDAKMALLRHFNAKWYLDQNPDVLASGMDTFEHYIRVGKEEGRQPSPKPFWALWAEFVKEWWNSFLSQRKRANSGKTDGFIKYASSYAVLTLNTYVYQLWDLARSLFRERSRGEMTGEISIVVPTLCRGEQADHLPKLKKLLAEYLPKQSYKNYEAIVFCDGRNERVEAMVASLKDNRIKVCFTEKAEGKWGHPRTRLGIARATGEYFVRMNDDNKPYEHYLETLLSGFDNEAGITYGRVVFRGTARMYHRRSFKSFFIIPGDKAGVLRVANIDCMNYMVKMDLAKKYVDRWNDEFCADWSFLEGIVAHGHRAKFIDEIIGEKF